MAEMPMPHSVQKRKIVERLKGLGGKAKINEIRKILEEIPKYKSGPYGKMRSWLADEIEGARTKRKVKAVDVFAVKKEGAFQVGLIGQPSTGKSSLVKALSGAQIAVADYSFTTLKPHPAIIQIQGVDFQLVDLPGLIEEASKGKGLGKRVLSAVRTVDGIAFVHDVSKPLQELEQMVKELVSAGIKPLEDKPAIIIANKIDLLQHQSKLGEVGRRFKNYKIVPVSATESKNLGLLKAAIWEMTGWIKVYSFGGKERPVPLPKDATVKEFAERIHKDFVESFKYAKIWGPSAKFAGQRVGLSHILQDNDEVEIVLKNV